MPYRSQYIRGYADKIAWGRAGKAFATYLNLAGKELSARSVKNLANAGTEFMKNEDWDWPRGVRYDTTYRGKPVRASKSYASGFRGGDQMHPWYSGNLHDSIAMGVMSGARIMAARYMPAGASSNQTYNGSVIFGPDEGMRALQHASHTFAPGTSGNTVRAVMVIGVPYADFLNEADYIGWNKTTANTHKGYADYLEEEFYKSMLPAIEQACRTTLKLK